MAKPTLALIPASQGSKLFSVLPSSGVGDFDFSRGSAATRINSQGLIENVLSGQSRLDYPLIDGVVNGCPSLLLEPQRTNIITYSEDFSNSSWIKDDATINSNSIISPDGTQNASTLIGNTVNSRHGIAETSSLSSVDASYTIFVKAKELRYIQIASANSVNQYVNFDLLNGVLVVGSDFSNAKIEDYGNGWYKCTVVSDDEYNGYYLSLVSGLNATWLESWVMPNNTDGLYIYGAQLEEGSYPTSYIPTNGTTVTRLADTANGAGDASTFNSSEGVLMAEISALSETTDVRVLSISDGTTSNMVFIRFDTLNRIIAEVTVLNGGSVNPLFIAPDITSFNKIALKWALNDVALWVNGIEVSTISVIGQFAPNTLNVMNLSMPNLANTMDAKTKQIQYFQTALTDSELEQLTSWISFTDMANGQLYTIE